MSEMIFCEDSEITAVPAVVKMNGSPEGLRNSITAAGDSNFAGSPEPISLGESRISLEPQARISLRSLERTSPLQLPIYPLRTCVIICRTIYQLMDVLLTSCLMVRNMNMTHCLKKNRTEGETPVSPTESSNSGCLKIKSTVIPTCT